MSVPGIRNNNPGNIVYSPLNRWVGQTGCSGRFCVFDTPEHGIRAIAVLLTGYAHKGFDTVVEIITKWAPPNENNTASYIEHVKQQMGVTASEMLNIDDPIVLTKLVTAIILHENGVVPYTPETIRAAVKMAVGT